ncbi:MAG TPA: hypothetical protein VK808_04900, partial [Bacteroidia bacterium]|nr:hypothetical protein [Bacteroidia bacterium]
MKHKKITFPLFTLFILLLFNSLNGFSQAKNNQSHRQPEQDGFESIYSHWFSALDQARTSATISGADFDVFTRFSQKALDSVRGDFMKRIGDKKITASNIASYEPVLTSSIITLYKKFEAIENLYPTSVEEYRKNKPMSFSGCNPSCNNIDFETGDLSGWNAYYGFNNSSTTAFVVTNITGGVAGPVTHAANDVLTSTSG